MALIQGIPVTLVNSVDTGKRDKFNAPIYTEEKVVVENVLVSPTSSEDIANALAMTGKKAEYTIAIPKGDTHVWEDQIVEFFGHRWRVIAFPEEGIEQMIPLDWNKKYKVERYE